jgi:hypothetical protein
MTRAEHLQWCKDRALEYVDAGDLNGAIASMTSDLRKHKETASLTLMALCMHVQRTGEASTTEKMRKFINDFN